MFAEWLLASKWEIFTGILAEIFAEIFIKQIAKKYRSERCDPFAA